MGNRAQYESSARRTRPVQGTRTHAMRNMLIKSWERCLADELLDTADLRRTWAKATRSHVCRAQHLAAAERLEELAATTNEIPPALSAKCVAALETERLLGNPDAVLRTMPQMILEVLHPKDIVEVYEIYVEAVNRVVRDPSLQIGSRIIYYFWY